MTFTELLELLRTLQSHGKSIERDDLIVKVLKKLDEYLRRNT